MRISKYILVFLALCVPFHAEENQPAIYVMDDSIIYNYYQGEPMPKNGSAKQYNVPGSINVKGASKLIVTADLLYWQVTQAGLTFAKTSKSSTALNPLYHGRFLEPKFNYRPGLKLGIGRVFSHDDWNIYSEWTHINGRGNFNNDKPIPGTLYPTRLKTAQITGITPVTCTYASAESRINYNIADLSMGRPYYTGRYLIFQPTFYCW